MFFEVNKVLTTAAESGALVASGTSHGSRLVVSSGLCVTKVVLLLVEHGILPVLEVRWGHSPAVGGPVHLVLASEGTHGRLVLVGKLSGPSLRLEVPLEPLLTEVLS